MPGICLVLYHCDSEKQLVNICNKCMFMFIYVWEEEYVCTRICVCIYYERSVWKDLKETPANIHLYFFQFPVGLP